MTKIIGKITIFADMAESADALDSGSSGSNTVCVQVTLSAPYVGKPKTAYSVFTG